jgi:ADP-ribose pyrophosphatase YjhB (NUDIX family)
MVKLAEETQVDIDRIDEYGNVHVREATHFTRDGVRDPRTVQYFRYVVGPLDDLKEVAKKTDGKRVAAFAKVAREEAVRAVPLEAFRIDEQTTDKEAEKIRAQAYKDAGVKLPTGN